MSLTIDTFIAPACKGAVAVLYQDGDILLIEKPGGLLSLSGKNPLNWDSVHHRLINGQQGLTPAFPTAKLPHRLDFGTSGIMVVGLGAESTKLLNKQFQQGAVKKRYVAMLEGWLADDVGRIDLPIANDKSRFPRVKICQSTGKSAVSEYAVLQRLEQPRRTLVEFAPLTGRTHQLRVHSNAIGHPILGCDLYNSDTSEQLAARLTLHATDLTFPHPATGELFHGNSHCPF